MIRMILCGGMAAVLVTSLIRGISDTYRGMICWTFSAVASVAAAVVYFSGAGELAPDLRAILTSLSGAGAVGALVLLIELFAPAGRFRTRERTEYDRPSAENALNIVMIIISCACAISSVICEAAGAAQFSLFGIIPLAAVSIRQLSYFMFRAKRDTLTADADEALRTRIIRELGSGRRSL